MRNSTNLRTIVDGTFEKTDKAYQELVAIVKQQVKGEINFSSVSTTHSVRFVWLDSAYRLKGDYLSRIRIADCSWNGELEVLPEYSNPEDDFEWVSFGSESDFILFNLNEILEGIEALEKYNK